MPEGLNIDHNRNLNGTMPPYAQHVIIRTGRDDWSSRIEDDPSSLGTHVGANLGGRTLAHTLKGGSNLARTLKGLVGPGGKFHDPDHPVLITNSSAARGNSYTQNANYHTVHVFPECIYFPCLNDDLETIERFAWKYLCSPRKKVERRDDPLSSSGRSRDSDVMILVCGHKSRDSRCGTLGPILQAEFKKQIWVTLDRSITFPLPKNLEGGFKRKETELHPLFNSNVGMCSHIGGHAFAGNVIINFPQHFRSAETRRKSPLAGKAVWYGRVEPRHVEGIIQETLLGGRLIEDLLRGVFEAPKRTPFRFKRLELSQSSPSDTDIEAVSTS